MFTRAEFGALLGAMDIPLTEDEVDDIFTSITIFKKKWEAKPPLNV